MAPLCLNMAKDTVDLAVELADGPDDVDDKIAELSAFGSREDRIAAEASRL